MHEAFSTAEWDEEWGEAIGESRYFNYDDTSWDMRWVFVVLEAMFVLDSFSCLMRIVFISFFPSID